MSNIDLYFGFGKAILIARPETNGLREGTLYPNLAFVNRNSLLNAPIDVLQQIHHLRIDTINACNLSCVFCHSDFSGKVEHLQLEDFSLSKFPNLKMITLGCAYEPLMGKNFELFPKSISEIKGMIDVNIVTNGLLLHKKDISPWVQFGLKSLYVSVYSHIIDVYERIARKEAKFKQIEMNLLDIRQRYPSLEVNIVTPVCKSNNVEIAAFCDWVFEKIGAKSLDIRRAFFVSNPKASYPAYSYWQSVILETGSSPQLTEYEWADVLQNCKKYMSESNKRTISLGEAIKYDSIVLSRSSFQNECMEKCDE